eukprot:5694184-Pyramimonas_sp.AAC.1
MGARQYGVARPCPQSGGDLARFLLARQTDPAGAKRGRPHGGRGVYRHHLRPGPAGPRLQAKHRYGRRPVADREPIRVLSAGATVPAGESGQLEGVWVFRVLG